MSRTKTIKKTLKHFFAEILTKNYFELSRQPSIILLMRKKVFGFTLIELLVTMGVSVILAVIAIPSVMNWYKKDEFLRQTQEVMDTLQDARAASLSEKKCPNGTSSDSWIWDINNSDKAIRLGCTYPGYHDSVKEFTLDENIEISNIAYQSTPASSWVPIATDTKNGIEFLSSSNGASKGWIESAVTGFNIRKIKFTFEFPEDTSVRRTICFDRIAGFPSISTTNDCDD